MHSSHGPLDAIIVETEAYGGHDDPASHAAFRPGGRAALMAAAPGHIYVYAAYGMYPCLNIVAEPEGRAAAVLIRGIWVDGDRKVTLGPGRTTRRLGVVLSDHGRRIGDGRFAIGAERRELRLACTPRIGITRGVETPWRFVADMTPEWQRP